MTCRTALLAAMLCAAAQNASFAYIRLGYTESGGAFVPLSRYETAGIQYFINDQIKPGQVSSQTGSAVTVIGPGSDPVAAVRAAMDTWNAVPGVNFRFLPLKTTSALHDSGDYQMTIAFAASADDLSLLGYSSPSSPGAIAITRNTWAMSKGQLPNGTPVDKGSIADADIILNPALTFSTENTTAYDLQAVLTHELGHALGANHAALFGATMFPFSSVGNQAVVSQRLMSTDETAFAQAVYGVNATGLGSLAGKVTKSDGSAVQAALITLIDCAAGTTIGAITSSDGTWMASVPPGKYIAYAEPFNSVVGAGNIIGLEPAQVSSGFQTTVAGGALTPTEYTVVAGAAVSVNITAAVAAGTLSPPFSGVGSAGGKGDILNVKSLSAPLVLPSGMPFDLGLVGGGADASTQIVVLGPGISVRPGSTRVDSAVSFGAGPLLRATLDVDARTTPALATLLLVKGAGVISFSGYLVLTPPKPSFVSRGIVSAASYKGVNGDGAVSPGGLYSIYDLPGAPNLGPASYAVANGYDAYGAVPSSLSGVSVLFDGVPAPMFFSFNSQLNVQAPFELAGRQTTQIQVSYNGSISDPVKVPVVPGQPAFFTYTPAGTDSIAGNQDYTYNTQKNPEARGRVVTLYGTGIGKTSYAVTTGKGAPPPPDGYSGNGTCTLNGSKAVSVAFTGWTPTAVGLAQWSMVLPADAPTGQVTVTCTDPLGAATPPGTLYIK